VLLAAFLAIESRVAQPMLPLHLFRRPAFTGVQLAAFAVSTAMFAMFLYLTLYLQSFLGHSPTEAGIRYLPITVATFLAAPVAGVLMTRVQAKVLIAIGLAGSGAGLLWMSGIGATDEWTGLVGGFLIAGAGVGLLNPVIADVALKVVPREQSGMAAGINDTFRQVGIALGVALWGAIFLNRGSSRVEELVVGTAADQGDQPRLLVEAASSGNLDQAVAPLPAISREGITASAREGFLAGLNDILVLAGGLAIVGALLTLWLVREQQIEEEPVAPTAVPEPAAA
jgi:MFS family permease